MGTKNIWFDLSCVGYERCETFRPKKYRGVNRRTSLGDKAFVSFAVSAETMPSLISDGQPIKFVIFGSF
jgi:hypothetical protein